MSQNTRKSIAPSFASPGRVTVDQRGHSIWQWEGMDTDSTSLLLKRLDNDALELEPTRSVPIPHGTGGAPGRGAPRDPRSGGDRPGAVRGTGSAGAAGRGRTSPRRAAAPADVDEGIQLEATLSVRYGGGFNPYDNTPR